MLSVLEGECVVQNIGRSISTSLTPFCIYILFEKIES